MVFIFYLRTTLNYTFRVIRKVNIFVYMDDEQFSPELTALLSKLNKGHGWENEQVQVLRAPERAIFTEAADNKSRVRRKEFTEMIKGK